MEKRYQVFVSSTYEDLQMERQEVMHALLELDCIPAGMELFPAANEDQWSLIKNVIDDCDYYIVIIGGRYGTLGPTGISYTEMEYRYALENGKPTIAFLHREPGLILANKCEKTDEGKLKLEEFRAFVGKKVCKYWSSPQELGSVVSRSLIRLIKTDPAIGWVKANTISEEANLEILKLRNRVEMLERQLDDVKTKPPESTSKLAHGDDEFEIHYSFVAKKTSPYKSVDYTASFTTTWGDVFSTIAPIMINEAPEISFKKAINRFVEDQTSEDLSKDKDLKGMHLSDFEINAEDFDTIKVQLRALGLIKRSDKNRSVHDHRTYWTLTPYGDTYMIELRAIQKDE